MATAKRLPPELPEDPIERHREVEKRMAIVFERRRAKEQEAAEKRAKAAAAAAADRSVVLAEQSRAGHARRALRREGDAMSEIRRERIRQRLTLDALSSISGVPRSVCHTAETGRPASARTIARLRLALGLEN